MQQAVLPASLDIEPKKPVQSAEPGPSQIHHRYLRVNHLARKPNYDFEKRRKEEERKRKKEEKRARRQAGGGDAGDDQADGSDDATDTDAETEASDEPK